MLPQLLTLAEMFLVLMAAYFAYWLGMKAYFRQKEYENVRTRYLECGIELVCSQIDYALGVYRHNWMLALRTLKQYRDVEQYVSIKDFYSIFLDEFER